METKTCCKRRSAVLLTPVNDSEILSPAPSKMPNLSDDMLSALTKQAACEAYNSNTYLQIALFWDGLNYGGSKLLKNISIIILNG